MKYFVVGILVAFIALGAAYYYTKIDKKKIDQQFQKGKIIILNGPSAAGKTTLAREIQKTFDEIYLVAGIDGFFDAVLPPVDAEGKTNIKAKEFIRDIEISKDATGHQVIKLIVGPAGQRAIKGMHRALAGYAEAGNNMVVDYILYEKEWLPDLVAALKDYTVYFVGVRIPLEILEEREKARGTSPAGHARSHYDTVHVYDTYDVEVDTSKLKPEEAAGKIKEFIAKNPEPRAFKVLEKKFQIE